MKPLSVVPMHPPESGQLHILDCLPRTAMGAHRPSDELGLVVTVDGLGQSIVVAIPDGSDRGSCQIPKSPAQMPEVLCTGLLSCSVGDPLLAHFCGSASRRVQAAWLSPAAGGVRERLRAGNQAAASAATAAISQMTANRTHGMAKSISTPSRAISEFTPAQP